MLAGRNEYRRTIRRGPDFTWRGEQSDDGKTWNEFMMVEVDRIQK